MNSKQSDVVLQIINKKQFLLEKTDKDDLLEVALLNKWSIFKISR